MVHVLALQIAGHGARNGTGVSAVGASVVAIGAGTLGRGVSVGAGAAVGAAAAGLVVVAIGAA
jgi:hypothetical protein